MDFSSIPRALESLHRRQPPLSEHILSVTNDLYSALSILQVDHHHHHHKNHHHVAVVSEESETSTTTLAATTSTDTTSSLMILKWLQELMCDRDDKDDHHPPRWESLAVGLYIATELVLRMSSTTSTRTEHSVPNKNDDVIATSSQISIASRSPYPVYMDGPRVPTITTSTTTLIPTIPSTTTPTTTTTTTTSTNQAGNHANHVVAVVPFTESETVALLHTMHHVGMEHLEHPEPRVRTLVARAVGAYSARIRSKTILWSTIYDTTTSTTRIDTDNENDKKSTTELELLSFLKQMHHKLLQSIEHHIQLGRTLPEATSTATTTTTNAVVDDTTGWRAIETNWLCLASFIHGLSDQYYYIFPFNDVSIGSPDTSILFTNCAYSAIQHVNRHVRAAAMHAYEQLIQAITLSIISHNDENLKLLLSEPASLLRTTLIDIVKTGLADNWSQVRMASSVLCRVWFQSLMTLQIDIREPIMMSALLPRMCLNRFYLAQGVKLYSHETWKMIFGSSISSSTSGRSLGLELVVEHIHAMIRYYIQMCDADNHAVREAACQAIAELAVKIGTNEQYQNVVLDERQIQNLISALLMCFYDESWPVRDEACLACAILCKAFPQACHAEVFHKNLWERFTEQLTDQIWSVRENAAVAMGDVLEAYGNEILPKVQTLIKKLLPSAKEQPVMSAKEFKAHVNDLKQHTDNQLYSCGSLAPKLRKGGAGRIGCTNCGIDRPKAPWEATDGCIYLIREYVIRRTIHGTTIPISDDELIPLCTELADVCRVRHFPQSDEMRATLWKCLPLIAATLGQQRFKNQYLEIFMDLLFCNLESSSASQLSHHAAGQCAEELALLIGMNMFRARLEDHQRQIFDRIVQERQIMLKGPAGGSDIFSPFGPSGLLVDNVPP